MAELILYRHGQTDWNNKNIMQGRTNTELNSIGRDEVVKSIPTIPNNIVKIISSPLKRTYETSQIISKYKNLEIVEDSRIIAREFGELTGVDIDLAYKNISNGYKNIEPLSNITKRINNFLEEYQNKTGTYLVLTHGAVILQFLSIVTKQNHSWTTKQINNCSYLTIVFRNKWELE